MKNDYNIDSQYMQNNCITSDFVDKIANDVVKLLVNVNLKISTAESLTGGMISQYITSVSGSSDIFEFGICSYSDRIKIEKLGVNPHTIEKYTAVSENTAIEMAKGILSISNSDIAVSTTGIAGPTGATENMPVGTVFVCVMNKTKYICKNLSLYKKFPNADREQNRLLTTAFALEMISEIILQEDNNAHN